MTQPAPAPPRLPRDVRALLLERARLMRRTPTRSEELLWQALRGRALGVKFRRQHPIGPYIVDFFCAEASLVVEVDGAVHLARAHCDRARDAFLAHHGLRVVRVAAWRVERQLTQVLATLRAAL